MVYGSENVPNKAFQSSHFLFSTEGQDLHISLFTDGIQSAITLYTL